MKKIERIRIAGHSFFFEEDAFLVLDQFIGQIHSLYKDNGEELKVTEVENRIAGMCHDRVGEEGIVTLNLIKEVISAIGIKVEEPVTSKTTSESDNARNDDEQNSTWYKAMLKGSKLYRNKHGNILGGVLSGIAIHYDMDVTTLRVITLVLFVLPLQIPVMLAYMILWVVLPKATTIMDYTRMRRVKGNREEEVVRQAWKNNYERCVAELSVPADKGCLYSLVRMLFFILFVVMVMPFAMVVFILLLLLFVFVVAGWGVLEVFNIPFMMIVGVIISIAIPVFMLGYLVLKSVNLCKPMKSKTKKFLVVLWVIVLLLVTPVLHGYIEDHGGYRNIDNIIEYQWNSVKAIFCGDMKKFALMTGNVSYSSGSLYNIRHIDSDCDAVIASVWDVGRENVELPLIVESVHDSAGKYVITLYTHGNDFYDSQEKLLGEEYDARIEMQFLPGDEIRGWYCFAWDSISCTVYYGGISYEATGCTLQGCRTEELTSRIKLRTMETLDGITFDNAAEHGLVPFRMFYYGNQRTPSIVVGYDDDEVKEIATMVKLRGRYSAKAVGNSIRNIKINKDVTDKIDNLLNGIADDVDNIADMVDEIADASEDIVSLNNIEFLS